MCKCWNRQEEEYCRIFTDTNCQTCRDEIMQYVTWEIDGNKCPYIQRQKNCPYYVPSNIDISKPTAKCRLKPNADRFIVERYFLPNDFLLHDCTNKKYIGNDNCEREYMMDIISYWCHVANKNCIRCIPHDIVLNCYDIIKCNI